jgi:Holliday junction resolvasome RuvABC endonuclease subunit
VIQQGGGTTPPDSLETEAEEDNIFILEELITKLTAKDPLANRLTQLNEHIRNMQKQLMMEETAPEEEYERDGNRILEGNADRGLL